MKRLNIIVNNQVVAFKDSNSSEELNSYIQFIKENKSWGRFDELVETILISEAIIDEEGNELEPAVVETIVHPPEFTILEEDIQSEIEREERLKQIEVLESQITPRRVREALLGNQESVAFIAQIEEQIELLREELKGL